MVHFLAGRTGLLADGRVAGGGLGNLIDLLADRSDALHLLCGEGRHPLHNAHNLKNLIADASNISADSDAMVLPCSAWSMLLWMRVLLS